MLCQVSTLPDLYARTETSRGVSITVEGLSGRLEKGRMPTGHSDSASCGTRSRNRKPATSYSWYGMMRVRRRSSCRRPIRHGWCTTSMG